jgi:hypothetical protein
MVTSRSDGFVYGKGINVTDCAGASTSCRAGLQVEETTSTRAGNLNPILLAQDHFTYRGITLYIVREIMSFVMAQV